MVKYVWNEKKRKETLKTLGLDFADAKYVFNEEAFIIEDTRIAYDEPRYILLGPLFKRIVVIIFCFRNETIRIISMRKANKREQRRYYEKKNKTT